ncbi:MAG: LamG domain-containing protein [Phycisphaerae bacterium]|nr:LamG domain-containing protein [Phycisphaerae bacterium]
MNRKNTWCICCVALLGLWVCPAGAVGPVGHWRFDEGSGTTVADSSGNNFAGRLVGDPAWVPGKVGSGALSFDGSNGMVEVPEGSALDLDSRLTISAWVNLTDFLTYYFIVCKSPSGTAPSNYPGNYEFRVQPATGLLELGHQSAQGTAHAFYPSATPITTGRWYFVAVTLEKGGRVEFYIDGTSAGGAAQTINFGVLNNEPVRIGGRKDGYSFFNGQIDDVRIYNRVLTAEQIDGLHGGIDPTFFKAGIPAPADGGMLDKTAGLLTWRAGDLATSHKIYLSENFEDVNAGTVEPFTSKLSSLAVGVAPRYPTGLTPGQTYYWRVDELNESQAGSPWRGDVWSFRVRPLIAWDPMPTDSKTLVSPQQELAWQAGISAIFHTVYFGTDFEQVSNATAGFATTDTTYNPEPMEPNTTYYWRVDEFAGQMRTGDVWSFTTVPQIEVADDSLLGWWRFDEADAGSAVDWSGHGLHGMIHGDPGWTEGPVDGAALLDGVDDYFATSAPADVNLAAATMTAWIMPTKVHGMAGLLFHRGADVCGMNLMASNQLGYHWLVAGTWGFNSGLIVPTNEWSFVALVVEPDQATLYLDGGDLWAVNGIAHEPALFDTGLMLAYDPAVSDRCFAGAIDDLRLYTKALTAEEIDEVMNHGAKPEPVDNPLMIDSFDNYNAYNEATGENIWDVWSDGFGGNGSGSTIGYTTSPLMERILTVGGHQSAPMYYDNSGSFLDISGKAVTATYSAVSRTFSPARDFTRDGAVSLVFWVRGAAANTVTTGDVLSVTLDDGQKSARVVVAQADDLKLALWRKIEVPLASLDVNTKKVTQLTITVGTPAAAAPGGKGLVYLDNIALETE